MSSSEITKKALADAMKILMCDKPMSKISVGDIVDICGLTRNSFYYHFKDKYDIVNWIFYTDASDQFREDESESDTFWIMIERLSFLLYKDKKFYLNALSVDTQNSFDKYFLNTIKETLMGHPIDVFNDELKNEFYVDVFSSSLANAFFRWLKSSDDIPPDKFTSFIKESMIVGAKEILKGAES